MRLQSPFLSKVCLTFPFFSAFAFVCSLLLLALLFASEVVVVSRCCGNFEVFAHLTLDGDRFVPSFVEYMALGCGTALSRGGVRGGVVC